MAWHAHPAKYNALNNWCEMLSPTVFKPHQTISQAHGMFYARRQTRVRPGFNASRPQSDLHLPARSHVNRGVSDICSRKQVAVRCGAVNKQAVTINPAIDQVADSPFDYVVTEGTRLLKGKHKWLGGVVHSDKLIYGIPAHAEAVLKVDPATGAVSTFGGPFPLKSMKSHGPCKFKWLRGVKARDGDGEEAIFGIPAWADSVLKMVPRTGEVTTLGQVDKGKWMWHGAAVGGDGNIYAVPSNAEHVLKINPITGEVGTVGGRLEGQYKWYGGVCGPDNKVYCIPHTAHTVLRITPETGAVEHLGDLGEGAYKWHGGVLGRDGCIYGFPAHADAVLKIDCASGEVSLIGDCRIEGVRYKWLGGCVAADGTIFAIPSNASCCLKIVPGTDEVTMFGEVSSRKNKWQGAVLGPDNCIYAVPSNADSVLKIDPATLEVTTLGILPTTKDKWQGGFLGDDGVIYGIPESAEAVLKIVPATQEVSMIPANVA